MAHVKIVHIPFQGGAPALTALMSGEVEMNFENSLIVVPHINAGRVRAIAVTGVSAGSSCRTCPLSLRAVCPDTTRADGTDSFCLLQYPKEIVSRLANDFNRILRMPDVVERLSGQGAEPVINTPEQFTAFIRTKSISGRGS